MDEVMRLIQQQLESSDSEVRIVAARQLSNLSEISIQLFSVGLGDDDWRVRKAAVETFFLLSHPENLIPELIEFLSNQDNVGLRNSAIEILIGLGSLAVAELQRELDCPDIDVRKFVIDILGEIGDARCADMLIGALADVDVNVRYAAVETLGKLKVESAITPLLELMQNPDPGLRFTILQALSCIGGAISIAQLLPFLDDRLLRKALFDCFGNIGGKDVVPHLVNGLTDPMRHVREAALGALFVLRLNEHEGISRALETADHEQIAIFLEQHLAAEDLQFNDAALAFYGAVARKRDLSTLLNCAAEERLRHQTLAAFAVLGEESYSNFIHSIDSPETTQLLYLIFVGGELGFRQALSLAIDGVRSDDPQLRYASARALGKLGGHEQVALLLQLLDDEITDIQDVATAAIAALGKRHRSAVLEQIAPMLVCSDADKRMRAVRILSLIDGAEIEALLLRAFKDSSSRVRCETIKAFEGRSGDLVISGLTLSLTDESAEVRRLAVSALGQCPQKKVFSALALAADDSDLWVRSAVMRSLELFSGADVKELLLRGAADTVGLVVIAALESAATVMPDECQQLLENALSHQDEKVVKSAMILLGRIKNRNWIKPFSSALLEHSHWDVRVHAAEIIGDSCFDEAFSLLENRLKIENDSLVRQAIEFAVSRQLVTESRGR